jgi:type I restriction enzyme M protein
MSTVTQSIVQKLWSLCNVLRDAGIGYQQYVTELTLLLFLKMAKETAQEKLLPAGYRWDDLRGQDGELLAFYRGLLAHLGAHGSAQVRAIFSDAGTALKEPRHLRTLVDGLDRLDWFEARREGLGDVYEGLLAKNAGEIKSGAGQYFTPRPLIDCMVACLQPRPGEVVQDPAAGTGGFLVAAHRWMRRGGQGVTGDSLVAMELVDEVQRLLRMNFLLHDIAGRVVVGDALSSAGAALPPADVILTNPPFGTRRGGGGPSRGDLIIPTANKQLAFLQHIHRGLRPGGRAGVVVPDNVLFEDHTGRQVRADLLERCDVHTVLRLPPGIFYAQGVKTHALFFTRGRTDAGNTTAVWVYDLRSGMPSFGKRTPVTRGHFAAFEAAYGDDPHGKGERRDEGPRGRWRRFSREALRERGDNLDISWLGDESTDDDAGDPEAIAAQILGLLRVATDEIAALQAALK